MIHEEHKSWLRVFLRARFMSQSDHEPDERVGLIPADPSVGNDPLDAGRGNPSPPPTQPPL